MTNKSTGEELEFDSTYAAWKYFNKSNSCFCKKLSKGGGIINSYHSLSDRVDEKECDSNDDTENIFDTIEIIEIIPGKAAATFSANLAKSTFEYSEISN